MTKEQEQVLEFHRDTGAYISKVPNSMLPMKETALRLRLLREEFDEVIMAINDNDIRGIADGLADLMYVVLGTAISYGIDMEPIFKEVHRSNMTKLWCDADDTCNEANKEGIIFTQVDECPEGSVCFYVGKDKTGKVIKPPSYSPPDLEPILRKQSL